MPGGLFGGPSGSSGTGTGSTANVYTPKAQPQADKTYQDIVRDIYNEVGSTGAGSPAGLAYPQAQGIYSAYFDPFNTGFAGATNANYASAGAEKAAELGMAGAPRLQSSGLQLLETGFDPQRRLFERGQQRLLDQTNVANSMAGLGGTPYGASVNANALANFDIDWENALLKRMTNASAAAGPLIEGAPKLAAYASGLPYNTGSTIATGAINALNNLTSLGNNQYLLPQQILNDLQSYLKLGQSASQISGDLGQLGFSQLSQGIGGALSGANALFGSNGLFSSGSGGSSGLLSNAGYDAFNAQPFMSGGGDFGTVDFAPSSSSSPGGLGLIGSALSFINPIGALS